MSYRSNLAGNLTRSTSVGATMMGWFKPLSYGGLSECLMQGKGLLGAGSVATMNVLGVSYLAATAALLNTPLLPPKSNRWVFCCLINTGTQLDVYTRIEDETVLRTDSMLFVSGSYSDAFLFTDFLGDQSVNAKLTAYKEWDTATRLDSVKIFQESQWQAPMNTLGLSNSLTCAVGTTIGQDQSGNGRNWTASGTILLDADEPNLFLQSPVGRATAAFTPPG